MTTIALDISLEPPWNPFCWGHKESLSFLFQQLQSKRMPHGFLITGPQGVGKKTFCYHVIRCLLSQKLSYTPPLFPGDSLFRRIAICCHGDLLALESKDNTPLKAEDVRSVQKFCQQKRLESPLRIIFIENIERLNAFAANALLKILEEPPPSTVFFLTCENPRKIVPTLRSRCLVMALRPFGGVQDILQHHGIWPFHGSLQERKWLFLALVKGRIGHSFHLLNNGLWEKAFFLCDGLRNMCLPRQHPSFEEGVHPNMLQVFSEKPLVFWQDIIINYLENLLFQGLCSPDNLSVLEKQAFFFVSQERWWYRLQTVKSYFQKGLSLHLDERHTLVCALSSLSAE